MRTPAWVRRWGIDQVKSSYYSPIAKSQTRHKRDKSMHKIMQQCTRRAGDLGDEARRLVRAFVLSLIFANARFLAAKGSSRKRTRTQTLTRGESSNGTLLLRTSTSKGTRSACVTCPNRGSALKTTAT
jgi:hypothetical protein